jgi:hypothetical protein
LGAAGCRVFGVGDATIGFGAFTLVLALVVVIEGEVEVGAGRVDA